jgi:hypothetical protein
MQNPPNILMEKLQKVLIGPWTFLVSLSLSEAVVSTSERCAVQER